MSIRGWKLSTPVYPYTPLCASVKLSIPIFAWLLRNNALTLLGLNSKTRLQSLSASSFLRQNQSNQHITYTSSADRIKNVLAQLQISSSAIQWIGDIAFISKYRSRVVSYRSWIISQFERDVALQWDISDSFENRVKLALSFAAWAFGLSMVKSVLNMICKARIEAQRVLVLGSGRDWYQRRYASLGPPHTQLRVVRESYQSHSLSLHNYYY